jgi:hypothetical protein
MRKLGYLAAVMAATLAAAFGPLTAASAQAAAPPVLTTSSGTAVAVGNLLASSLSSDLSITLASGGTVGLTCQKSTWQAIVQTNPPVPGTAVLQLINPFTISACGDNAPGVIGVIGVTVSGLPTTLTVNSTGALQIVPASPGTLVITVKLATATSTVVCTYTANDPVNGHVIVPPGTGPWTFIDQPLSAAGSPASICGSGVGYFSAAYSPVIDTSLPGSPSVVVN